MNTIEILKFDTECLSVEKFMSLTKKEKDNIKSVKIIPPKLIDIDFDDDFGKIQVKYKTPIYKAL